MTRRRKQKRRIRERMTRTGESYTTARSDLLRRAKTTVAAAPTFLVPVREMPRAIAFYRDALGFSVLRRSPDDTWAEVGDDATTIGLHRADVAGVDTGLGLLVASAGDACRRVLTHGGRIVDEAAGVPGVHVVQDPDGNVVRLMSSQ